MKHRLDKLLFVLTTLTFTMPTFGDSLKPRSKSKYLPVRTMVRESNPGDIFNIDKGEYNRAKGVIPVRKKRADFDPALFSKFSAPSFLNFSLSLGQTVSLSQGGSSAPGQGYLPSQPGGSPYGPPNGFPPNGQFPVGQSPQGQFLPSQRPPTGNFPQTGTPQGQLPAGGMGMSGSPMGGQPMGGATIGMVPQETNPLDPCGGMVGGGGMPGMGGGGGMPGMGGGGGMPGMGGGGGMPGMGGGPGMGGAANGTATTFSAMGMYSSARCLSIMGSTSLSLSEGSSASSLPIATGNTASLMGMLGYAPSRYVGLSLMAFSTIPVGSQNADPASASTKTNGLPQTVPGQTPMTLLNPSISVHPLDPLRLSLGLSHMINYSGVDSSFGVNGPRTPGAQIGGLGNNPGDLFQDATTLTASSSLSLSRNFALVGNVPYGFTSGILDPTGGFNFRLPVQRNRDGIFLINGGFLASVPASARSQEQGKITTVTGQFSPMLTVSDFSLSYMSQLSYSFYQDGYPKQASSSVSTPASISSSPERLRTLNSLNLSVPFTEKFRAFSSGSINYLDRADGTVSWGTQAVPFGVSYSPDLYSLSAYFALSSDPLNDKVVSFPNQPLLGGSISIRFGTAPPPTFGGPPRSSAGVRGVLARQPSFYAEDDLPVRGDPYGGETEDEIEE